jgi:predicted DNA-binding mobile mystery protein A
MTNKFKQIQLHTLDKHLAEISICGRPSDGWIGSIRKSLGMSVRQLANRIGITQQSTSRLELNEIHDSITLKTLRKAAQAMDCKLVYALVPNKGSLYDIVKKQAIKKSREIVLPVDHTMMLEAQSVGNAEDKIRQVADELTNNLNSKLWD